MGPSGAKERRGLWDFLDHGGHLVVPVCRERKDTRGSQEAQVSQV